jgi:hypothetical protein
VTLSAVQQSPQVAGTPVELSAEAIGTTGDYVYQFRIKSGIAWSVEQFYVAANTWLWDTTGLAPGTYTIQVMAKNASSAAAYEALKTIAYTLKTPPATGATLSPTPASPRTVGTPVAFNAGGIGGTGTYEYQFLYKRSTDPSMTMAQGYSTSGTWNWDTSGAAAGSYTIQVRVRSVGSTAAYDALKTIAYTLK